MIKVKNSLITKELIDVLGQLIEQDINATSAFKLSRLLKQLSSIFEDKFNVEKRIFDKYLVRGEDGNLILAKDNQGNLIEGTYLISDVESFNKEIRDLMEIENELNYDLLKFEDLGLQTAKIKDLMAIEFLFE
jgi:hypothetical protein